MKTRLVKAPSGIWQVRWNEGSRERRKSTGTRSLAKAKQVKTEVDYQILKNQDPFAKGAVGSDEMSWPEFMKSYRDLKQSTMRPGSQIADESRLNICAGIVRPATLKQMASRDSINKVRDHLLKTRGSAYTVKSYLNTLVASLNWAYERGWIDHRVSTAKVKTGPANKGRALDPEEVDRFRAAVKVVCPHDVDGWLQLVDVQLWAGLRIGEAIAISRDKGADIRAHDGKLYFSGKLQKNKRRQVLPIVNDNLLDLVDSQTSGYVADVKTTKGFRPTSAWAARVLSEVGKEADIIVNDAGKYASCHDLRRTALQEWANMGVELADLQFLARHENIATTQKYYISSNATIIGDRVRQVQSRYNGS